MSEPINPSVTKNILESQVQFTKPDDKYKFAPCGPELTPTDSSDLTVIFPTTKDTSKKTAPLMGGSIVKLSFALDSSKKSDKRYISYYKNINEKIKEIFNSRNIEIISKKSTSSLRVLFNKILIEEISVEQNIGVVPAVYLSTTGSDLQEIDSKTDYFGIIRKNTRFGFFPIESIQELLKTISYDGEKTSTIGDWSGLSGKKYKELYDIAKKESPDEQEIISLILDLIPFFNLSQNEMLGDPVRPALGGYFTIINNNIYLKMPDISGVDSAGYGDDYLSDLNLLFQLINDESSLNNDVSSVKNIEIKKSSPIYSNIFTVLPEEYSLKSPELFSVTFLSTKKPTSVYLSPIIDDDVSIQNSLFKSIFASQSGKFIEFTSYPNPFVSILNEKIKLDYHISEYVESDKGTFTRTTADKIDEPFYGVRYYIGNYENNFSDGGLGKIRATIDRKYNKGLGTSGPIGNYLSKVFNLSPDGLGIKPEDYFAAGFPLVRELFDSQSTGQYGGVIGQPLSTYEFVGNLSRQNLILHNGKAFNDNDPDSSGKRGNNAKFFKKNFVANSIGLCENYRPRVFSSPENFVPSAWIKSSTIINTLDGAEDNALYSATFSVADFLKFYTKSATKMKFAVYLYDGESQILKSENGYLEIDLKPPEIESINPDGTIQDNVVITCGESRLTITSKEAEYIDLVKINGVEIKRNDDWINNPGSFSFIVPCNVNIARGQAEVIISSGGLESSPVNIYIANGQDETEKITETSDLPSEVDQTLFSEDDVKQSNLKISGQNYEIPVSYTDPRSLIQIKSKKSIFKDGRDIYLYLGFQSEEVAKNFSQNIVSYKKDSNQVYVAKDFEYKLENSLSSDFYRKSKNKAYLYFPGLTKSNRPLELLTKDIGKVFLIISTRPPSLFSTEDNLGIIELGTDKKRAFIGPPTVIGVAAKYADDDRTKKNHLSNFDISLKEYSIASAILKEEGFLEGGEADQLIDLKDKFKKLIVLFSYRDIKKYKKKNFKLYINGELVSKKFLLDGVKRATSIFLGDVSEFEESKNLYYFVISNLLVSSDDPPVVSVDIYDPDFKILNNSIDKYKDYSFRLPRSKFSPAADDSGSIFTTEAITNSFIKGDAKVGYLFGNYEADLALTGFFLRKYEDNIFTFTSERFETSYLGPESFPGVSVLSNISGVISNSPEATENKVSVFKDIPSEINDSLPNSFFTISSNSEIDSGQYLSSSEDYLIFFRLKVLDICKIALLRPLFLNLPDNLTVIPGQILTFNVANISRNFVIEIAGVEARIVDVRKGAAGIYEVDIIVPEGIPTIIPADLCGGKIYNGNQTLGDGNNQLGNTVRYLDKVASGALGDTTRQYEKYKETLKEHPLKLASITIDAANLAKELITSFCNYSFKITGDLSINLQGFSQLLIPVKVIFCIIDVICNIFNPFQLPQAIIRLFECLYDLILLLPQISIPVMFFNLLIHLLDFLECLIVKIAELITAINLIVDAFALAIEGRINFREALMLEELLLKYVISLEADLELLGPIVQILGLFLQLLSISFRFPCSINPASSSAPCGIDGFELGSMISGLVAEASGSAPHIVYNLDKKYLLPIAQPFTKVASEVASAPSYEDATEPVRGEVSFDGSDAVSGNLYDISSFNPESMRKKSSSFDSNNIESISTDTVISLRASYTRRRKHLSSQQGVIFKFKERTWKSAIPAFDAQIIDEYQAFDTPVVLLQKDGENLEIASASSYGNLYSMIDGKSMLSEVSDDGKASVRPLTLDIIQNGISVERTFDTIPSMILMDEALNVYVIDEEGIVFGEYKTISGDTVVGIKEIRATIINQKSSTGEAFSKEDEVVGTDPPAESDGTIPDGAVEVTKSIFSLPQLYFVDTRVAAEAIQSKCETAAINQLPLDLTGDGGAAEVEKMSVCINDFLDSVRLQTTSIKNSLSVGSVPSRISQDQVDAAYLKLVDCTNDSINNLCSIVINPLNTSFKLLNDSDLTPILPDPVSSAEEVSGAEGAGPALTGAREYAGGIGDAVSAVVGSNVFIELTPRDSYDNLITYDLSEKSRLQIVSDQTGNAFINLNPTDTNPQNYWTYSSESGTYLASVTSSGPGIVKLKAVICNQSVQALTYSDLVDDNQNNDEVNCVDGEAETANELNVVPLGALSRIDRILTITFIPKESPVIIQSNADQKDSIITEPQLFGTNLEN